MNKCEMISYQSVLLQDSGSAASSRVVESGIRNSLWSAVGVVLNIAPDESVVLRWVYKM